MVKRKKGYALSFLLPSGCGRSVCAWDGERRAPSFFLFRLLLAHIFTPDFYRRIIFPLRCWSVGFFACAGGNLVCVSEECRQSGSFAMVGKRKGLTWRVVLFGFCLLGFKLWRPLRHPICRSNPTKAHDKQIITKAFIHPAVAFSFSVSCAIYSPKSRVNFFSVRLEVNCRRLRVVFFVQGTDRWQ